MLLQKIKALSFAQTAQKTTQDRLNSLTPELEASTSRYLQAATLTSVLTLQTQRMNVTLNSSTKFY